MLFRSERQAAREKRKAEGDDGSERRRERFDRDRRSDGEQRGERRFGQDRPRRDGFVSGYRDREDDRTPDTAGMSMDEKLAALASMFNKK